MTYLERFFDEKNLGIKFYDLTAPDGTAHIIESTVVIEAIHGTTGSERTFIEDTLRKIDFHNGDVHHFLTHLAQQLANNY